MAQSQASYVTLVVPNGRGGMAVYYVPSSYPLVLYPPSYQSSSPSLPPPPVVRRRIQRLPASSSPSPSRPPPSPATHYGVTQVLHSEKVKVLLQKALQKFSKLLALFSKLVEALSSAYFKKNNDTENGRTPFSEEEKEKKEKDDTLQEEEKEKKEKDDTSEKEKKKKK
nr:hypothetical protein Iba_chr10aCG15540 [Ipomoea batatas]